MATEGTTRDAEGMQWVLYGEDGHPAESIRIRRVTIPEELNVLEVTLTSGATTQGIQSVRGAVWYWLNQMAEAPRWEASARKGIEYLETLPWES